LQKIAIILLIISIIPGCSVFRNQGKSNSTLSYNTDKADLTERIRNTNISNNAFFIEKADVQISGPDDTQKFLCSLKFELPDKYLISLKSKTGIEAFRIYLSEDTILINDRFNKKVYMGRPQYLNKKFGLPLSFLPLIFGDYLSSDSNDNVSPECKEGKVEKSGDLKGLMLKYILDCKNAKTISISVLNSLNQIGIQMNFMKFLKKGNYLYPQNINIVDIQKHTSISIRIDKILLPWEGKIEFIPGYRYELVELL
jgi:hypothetical protein